MVLNLLPAKKIDNNIYRLICQSTSSGKVSDIANFPNSKFILDFCKRVKNFSLLIDTPSRWSENSISVSVFKESDLEECVKVACKNSKQIEEAGIEVFWKASKDGKLELKFCVNLKKIALGAEDLEKKLHHLSTHEVAPIINQILNEKPFPPDLFDFDNEDDDDDEDDDEDNNSEATKIGQFFNEVEKSTKNWKASQNMTIHSVLYDGDLCEYQKNTVQWMVKREEKPEIEILSKFSKFIKVKPPSGARHPTPLYYYSGFGLFSESSSLLSRFETKGGILADETGLGKTVEIMSLILSHEKTKFYELPMSKNGKKKKKKNDDDDDEKTRECVRCGEMVDLKESGWKKEFDEAHSRFQCVQCIAMQPPVEVKTTLIAVPEALMQHWLNEVIKNKLSYKVYSGMDLDGYVNPLQIASFDVILVSYEDLRAELSHTSKMNFVWDSASKSMSQKMQKVSLTSLTHVKWWRVVFDESQLINNPGCHVAQMCQLINAQNRWCVTNTPIENNMKDLFGLFRLIQFWPFNIEPFWNIVVAGFNDLIDKRVNLWRSLLLQLVSHVMRRTKMSTVIDQMGIPEVVEIEKVVEFSPIEDYRYKKAIEDMKDVVKSAVDKVANHVAMSDVDDMKREIIFGIIGNLKDNLVSGGEHDEATRWKHSADDIYFDPKNCTIGQISKKKMEIVNALPSTINSLLDVAGVKNLENKTKGAEGYADVANIFVMIEEINKYAEQMKCPEVIDLSDDEVEEDDDREQKPNGKRGPAKDAGKLAKIGRFEDPDERAKFDAEKRVKKEISQMKQNIVDPMMICDKLTTKFVLNMLDVQKQLGNHPMLDNAINKLGGKDKLVANLSLIIERFSKDQRNAFQIVREEGEKLIEDWDKKADRHTGMSLVLNDISDCYKPLDEDSKILATKLVELKKAKFAMMDMSFWPVFKNSQKHIEDGKLGMRANHSMENCMGVCNKSTFEKISKDYELSTNQQLLQHVFEYINRLETLRTEVLESYTTLISFFQTKFLDTTAKIQESPKTLACSHFMLFKDLFTDAEKRDDAKNSILCLICSAKFSLAHLSFELGVGSYHARDRKVRGKLPMEKFLAMLLVVEHTVHPDCAYSKQFSEFVEYLEDLRRTVGQVQAGCKTIEEYGNSLHKLYLIQRPIDMDRLRSWDVDRKYVTPEGLRKAFLKSYSKTSETQEKDFRALCGDLRYLISLYKKEGSNNDGEDNSCPICMDSWTNLHGFVGFPCGHRVCQKCYPHFRDQQHAHNNADHIKCSTCRKQFQHSDVIIARDKIARNAEQSLIPGVNLTSKLREAIKLMREIIASGSDENIVIFTSNKVRSPIWKYLVDVFKKAELPIREGTEAKQGSPFQFFKQCRILLCSNNMDQMGLDFTNANHVIFLEPTPSISVVDKCLTRVMRFGQKRKVTKYHMVVESSVDEFIRRISVTNEGGEWTVGDVRKIFNITYVEAPQRRAGQMFNIFVNMDEGEMDIEFFDNLLHGQIPDIFNL